MSRRAALRLASPARPALAPVPTALVAQLAAAAPLALPEGVGTRLAKNLVAARLAAEITQQQLAAAADVSRATIAQIEAGLGDPKLSTVTQLARPLGIAPLLLLVSAEELATWTSLVVERVDSDERLAVFTADRRLAQYRHRAASGLLRDRLAAAKWSAGLARSAGLGAAAIVGAAIGGAIDPGRGAATGAAVAELLPSI